MVRSISVRPAQTIILIFIVRGWQTVNTRLLKDWIQRSIPLTRKIILLLRQIKVISCSPRWAGRMRLVKQAQAQAIHAATCISATGETANGHRQKALGQLLILPLMSRVLFCRVMAKRFTFCDKENLYA